MARALAEVLRRVAKKPGPHSSFRTLTAIFMCSIGRRRHHGQRDIYIQRLVLTHKRHILIGSTHSESAAAQFWPW